MIKKILAVLCCVSLCLAVSLFFPFSGRSTVEVDDSLCLGCHTASGLHEVEGHNNCTTQCHENIPHGGVITFPVKSSKCVVCHPFDNPGECTLIDFHQGMTDCLSCHAADCEGGETTTTTATGSPSHIDTCLVCHDAGKPGVGGETIHGDHTDASCNDCHNGASRAGNVEPDNCIACHPFDNPGDCNLVDFHDPDIGGDCYKCHIDCDESTNSHIEECLLCHVVDDLHERSGHSGDCVQCHDGTPQAGNVQTDKCIVCHPLGNTGKCNLENYHDPGKGASCLECHFNCAGSETTTTTASTGGHEEDGAVDDTNCLKSCHTAQFGVEGSLHSISAHTDCGSCHEGTPTVGNVNASACIVCHSLGNPGKCSLANDHGSSCLECHTECAETTTTTTAASSAHLNRCLGCHSLDIDIHPNPNHGYNNGNCAECHEGNNVDFSKCAACHFGCTLPISHGSSCLGCHDECSGTTTTTTVPPFEGHIDICLDCHMVDNLHAIEKHSTCTKCHTGDIVDVGKCAVCHPTDDPSKCNLATAHGSYCLECHTECAGESTTTTVTGGHGESGAVDETLCLTCHGGENPFPGGVIHSISAHTDCGSCHEGTPTAGNVNASACIVCHSLGNPGKCSLANDHGSTCLECHFDCAEDTTTTTTTIDDFPNPVTVDIELKPDLVFRSHLLPLPLIMFIEGTESHFNQTTTVSFEGNAIWPPIRLLLSPTNILVISIINPAGLQATGSSEMIVNVSSTVDTGEVEPYEEIGSWPLTLTMLPFILDEEEEKLTGGT